MLLADSETTKTVTDMIGGSKGASKGVAGTALGLGIAGTALGLGLFGEDGINLFGRRGHHHHIEHEIDRVLAKENEDVLRLTNQIWGNALRTQENRFNDVTSINQKIFDSYVYTNSELAKVKEDSNNKFFANYKETRDTKDKLISEISELKTEVAVLKAIAPYQQNLTAAAINASAKQAEINLINKTQYMLEGVLVPPFTGADATKTTSNPSTGE